MSKDGSLSRCWQPSHHLSSASNLLKMWHRDFAVYSTDVRQKNLYARAVLLSFLLRLLVSPYAVAPYSTSKAEPLPRGSCRYYRTDQRQCALYRDMWAVQVLTPENNLGPNTAFRVFIDYIIFYNKYLPPHYV